ncbi:MAG: hypothetical protein HYX24_03960 [Candidatus Aenigmarchaeota archaeon]|nr:hypothetical protein [Candidatus Aenigmarchaeota archaeon]
MRSKYTNPDRIKSYGGGIWDNVIDPLESRIMRLNTMIGNTEKSHSTTLNRYHERRICETED